MVNVLVFFEGEVINEAAWLSPPLVGDEILLEVIDYENNREKYEKDFCVVKRRWQSPLVLEIKVEAC